MIPRLLNCDFLPKIKRHVVSQPVDAFTQRATIDKKLEPIFRNTSGNYKRIHPGQIVKEILIDGASLSVSRAAKMLGIDRSTLSRLINGNAGISAEMALRLSSYYPIRICFFG